MQTLYEFDSKDLTGALTKLEISLLITEKTNEQSSVPPPVPTNNGKTNDQSLVTPTRISAGIVMANFRSYRYSEPHLGGEVINDLGPIWQRRDLLLKVVNLFVALFVGDTR